MKKLFSLNLVNPVTISQVLYFFVVPVVLAVAVVVS